MLKKWFWHFHPLDLKISVDCNEQPFTYMYIISSGHAIWAVLCKADKWCLGFPYITPAAGDLLSGGIFRTRQIENGPVKRQLSWENIVLYFTRRIHLSKPVPFYGKNLQTCMDHVSRRGFPNNARSWYVCRFCHFHFLQLALSSLKLQVETQ